MSLPPSPTSPLLALRAAILAYLATDAALARLMGGSVRLGDEPPRGSAPVYALFGDAEIRDDSVDGARRHRHALGVTVFARPGSIRSAVDAAERIADLLYDAPLSLAGHTLVRLDMEAIAVRRDPASGEARATLTLRAITERRPA
ncbi:hypothetical protein ASF60_00315 [Methylobacterium sp. Leaf113]|uniref:DUF3168 domain-containing protein n=1 Tax=unclassified Methylobacterium TaxID=2615210 RepID=UPI0006F26840|nr:MULTISPECIES: DUF3168 domain-containing protein [unclassified Methylobacterium]KQP88077.1 hypothetical protein ASF57_07605 [Methylobacterium sp. Leaf117]KQP94700.1 hypothetical protein ASF60_00315 [Methylobacterium sp. Leaf113]